MSSDTSKDDLVTRLRRGENDAWNQLWESYGARLERVIKTRLPRRLHPALSSSDVLVSSFRTFCRRLHAGQYELSEADALWRLLCTIALNKVRQQHRRLTTIKRDVRKQISISAGLGAQEPADPRSLPEAAAVAEELYLILESMQEKEQQVIGLILQGYTQKQAADALAHTDRWVRLVISKLKTRLKNESVD